MKNSVIKKIPLGRKFRLFCDLDFKEQLITLIRFFAPLIVVAGLLKLYKELNKRYDIKRQQKYGVIGIEFEQTEVPNYADIPISKPQPA